METIKNLVDLLLYNIKILHSVEEQIIGTIPSIIEKAQHSSLKNGLKHHASLGEEQKKRLVKITHIINEKIPGNQISGIDETAGKHTSKAITGLIDEINQLLETNLSDEVKDAAIIASVQKIEHYEICAYGTAVAYANQLHLHSVAALLKETLQEEYDANDLLTALATAAINKEGLPEGLKTAELQLEDNNTEAAERDEDVEHTPVSISERTINSPGGRAGTSHRRYSNGESRGH